MLHDSVKKQIFYKLIKIQQKHDCKKFIITEDLRNNILKTKGHYLAGKKLFWINVSFDSITSHKIMQYMSQ